MRLILPSLLICLVSYAATPDTMFHVNNTGSSVADAPIGGPLGQVRRVFMDGEFCGSNFPQAVIGGTPVATQVNVLQSYVSGCIKVAELSALFVGVPTGTSTITFQNQASCNCTAQSLATMTGGTYNFDAVTALTNGTTVSVSALTAMNAGKYTVIYPGPVAQTIGVYDDSQGTTCNGHPASSLDIGFGSVTSNNCPLRPRWYVTFWQALGAVQIEYVIENANTEMLMDVAYSIALYAGAGTATPWYTHVMLNTSCPHTCEVHVANAAVIFRYWLGFTPADASYNVDWNAQYEINTLEFPNYDVGAFSLSSTQRTTDYSNWSSAVRDIFTVVGVTIGAGSKAGGWDVTQGAGGGPNPGIAPFPDYVSNFLFAQGDYRERQILFGSPGVTGTGPQFGQEDLTFAYPMWFREGATGHILNRGDTGSTGLGLPMSIFGRPGIQTGLNPAAFSSANFTNLTTVGTTVFGLWQTNLQHDEPFGCGEYNLTGDPAYLDECKFMTSFKIMSTYIGLRNYPSVIATASPIGGDGFRATAWHYRTVAEAKNLIPDSDSFETYVTSALTDAVCWDEGLRNINTDAACQVVGAPKNAYNYGVSSLTVVNGSNINNPTMVMPPSNTLPTTHQWVLGTVSTIENCVAAVVNYICTAGPGTITVSGTTVTFSDPTACGLLQVGQNILDSTGSDSAQIKSKAGCPTSITVEINKSALNNGTWTYVSQVLGLSQFMQWYIGYALGRCGEFFASCNYLRDWLGTYEISLAMASGSVPFNIVNENAGSTSINIAGSGTLCGVNNDNLCGGYYGTVTAMAADQVAYADSDCITGATGGTDGYCAYAMSAASYLAISSPATWNWYNSNVLTKLYLSGATPQPKWLVVPRVSFGDFQLSGSATATGKIKFQ